jgi:hypothetical protein
MAVDSVMVFAEIHAQPVVIVIQLYCVEISRQVELQESGRMARLL